MTAPRDLGHLYRSYLAGVVLFHFTAAEVSGLGHTDYQASSMLDLDQPLTNSQMAERLGLSPGATTRVVDRLVEFGLARRVQDPADRRRVLIEHTGEPPAELMAFLAPVREQIAELIATLSPHQVDGLRAYFLGAAEIYAAAARPSEETPGDGAGTATHGTSGQQEGENRSAD